MTTRQVELMLTSGGFVTFETSGEYEDIRDHLSRSISSPGFLQVPSVGHTGYVKTEHILGFMIFDPVKEAAN